VAGGVLHKIYQQLLERLIHHVGIALTINTSYHPQTNGEIEVANKYLEGYLSNIVMIINLSGTICKILQHGHITPHITLKPK